MEKPTSRSKFQIFCTKEEGLTQQSHAVGLSPREIVKRYGVNGPFPQRRDPGQFMDLSKVPDLVTALNQKVELDSYFLSLPSEIRFKFDNDAIKYAKFLSDPQNFAEAEKLGLLAPTQAEVDRRAAAQAAAKAKAEADDLAFTERVRKATTPSQA